jgi:hypothetical protein
LKLVFSYLLYVWKRSKRSALGRVKIAPWGRGLRSSKLRIQSTKCKPLTHWRKFLRAPAWAMRGC